MDRAGSSGWIVVAAVTIVSIALAFVSSQSLRESDSAKASSPADFAVPSQGLVLRLHDLPPGYRAVSGSDEFPLPGLGCAAIEPSDPRPRLAAFLRRYSPIGCLALYFQLYQATGDGPAPPAVGTGALETGSVEGAGAGLAVSRELLGHLLDGELPREVPAPEMIGDATRLYRLGPQRLFSSTESPSSFLVWRSGSAVGSIFVTGGRAGENDRAAVHFARLQQTHIETPTPYSPAEADDTEVALDDPALKAPVYWLGESFDPGPGFSRLRLVETFSSTTPSPYERLSFAGLLYTDHLSFDHAEMVELELWTPREWKARRAAQGLPFAVHCPKPRGLDLTGGRAVIYEGRYLRRRCGERGRKAYAAVIHFPGVIVTAEREDTCEDCAKALNGPYSTFKGMATIVRGLTPRLRPASAPATAP